MARPRDPEREKAILNSTIELLARIGYDRLTVQRVAMRAHASKATIYRRWPSKSALVVDAITSIAEESLPNPDTGSFIGDMRMLLHALVHTQRQYGSSMIALADAIAQHPEVAQRFEQRFIARRREVGASLFQRAVARGEVRTDVDHELIGEALSALINQRVLFYPRRSLDEQFIDRVIDGLARPLLSVPQHSRQPHDKQ